MKYDLIQMLFVKVRPIFNQSKTCTLLNRPFAVYFSVGSIVFFSNILARVKDQTEFQSVSICHLLSHHCLGYYNR